MTNIFGKHAACCEAEREEIEKSVIASAADVLASDDKHTTLSLSLTVSDK